jgi:hypothetical protein
MTKTTAASNGSTTSTPDKPEHGLMVLREKEAQGLISLACAALSQTSSVIYDLHQALYDHGETAQGGSRDRFKVLNEAVTCLRTIEHYLLMLSSVFEEQEQAELSPLSTVPPF